MRRMLYESRMVPMPAAALEALLLERGPELLAQAAGSELYRDDTDIDGSFGIDLPAQWAGMEFAKRVQVTIGVARRVAGRLMLPLSWEGEPGRHLFPVFEGTLEVGPMFRDLCELTLAGSYRVPLGPVGAALDATVLHATARDTAARLVQALASVVTEDAPPVESVPPSQGATPLRVRHVMTRDPLVVPAETGLRSATLALLSAGISAVPVVAADGGLLGVLSEHDLLAKEARRRFGFGGGTRAEERRREALTAGEACTTPALVTTPETLLADVARQMLDRGINRLVVVEHGGIVGIVSRRDVLEALVRDTEDVVSAVRAALVAIGAEELDVRIGDDGVVVLSGTVPLRSVAAQAGEAAAAVEGVMGVRADEVAYREDDVLPVMPMV
ncbi:MAG TPA: CBS domain-containing protein [Egibacteraceae bacterium]|nr:CBS domain-containing protein [Egibacteraceae bacterium]